MGIGKACPEGACGLEKFKRAYDVGLDEIRRRVNRPVDVRLGRQIDHCCGLVLLEQTADQSAIANVTLNERVMGSRLNL